MDTNPTNLLISSSPVEGLSAWMFKPLPQVGSKTAPLDTTPVNCDHASKFGCKSQNYTSWDCSSRSYLTCISSMTKKKQGKQRRSVDTTSDAFEPDIPTDQDKTEWTTVDHDMWEKGKKKFYQTIGLLTSKQIATQKYQKLIVARCVRDTPDSGTIHSTRSRRAATGTVSITDFFAVDKAYQKFTQGSYSVYAYPHPDSAQTSEHHSAYLDYVTHPESRDLVATAIVYKWPKVISQSEMDKKKADFIKAMGGTDCVVNTARGFWADHINCTQDAHKKLKKKPKKVDSEEEVLQTSESGSVIDAQNGGTAPAGSGQSNTSDQDTEDEGDPPMPGPPPTTEIRWKREVKINPDPNWEFNGHILSDTCPVRVLAVSTWRSEYEMNIPVPYSPVFTSILQRLQDPAATGALGSMARGPSIRDATSFISLAKAMQKSPSSVYELAPMIRLSCIIMALSSPSYKTEIIYHRVVRNWTTSEYLGASIALPNEPWKLEGYKFIAMPLDIFVSFMLNKYGREDCNEEFVYQGVDSEWTAIPVRSELLGETTIIPYIAAFLSSELWNGRICHRNRGHWTDLTDKKNPDNAVQTITPSCNSVHIQGPKKFILVMTDFSSGYPPNGVNISNIAVPVWKGVIPIPDEDIPDFANIWNQFFTTANINRVLMSSTSALNEIDARLGVENAGSIASSIAAELYLVNYQGIGIKTTAGNNSEPAYDFSGPQYGAWAAGNRQVITEGSRIIANGFNVNPADTTPGRRRLVGYNFSGVSAFMRPPTGVAKMVVYNDDAHDNTRGAVAYWIYKQPSYMSPGYNITTMDSIMRVSVYIDLILTSEDSQYFSSSEGHASWHHMLSMALTSQTTVMFAQSNINLAVWAGYDTRYDDAFSSFNLSKLIKGVFQGFVTYTNITELIRQWNEWDEDQIHEYYGMDPFNNTNWMSYSAVPYHLAVQWINKMKSVVGTEFKNTTYFRYRSKNRMALLVDQTSGEYRTHAVCTIDMDRYFPLVITRNADDALSNINAWVDQFSYISCTAASSNNVFDPKMIESQTFVLSPLINGLEYTPTLPMYIINSDFLNMTEQYRVTRVSDLMYPDPISLKDIISGAKNYVLDPIISAIMGFVRGGPTGALIQGGSRLAEKIIEATTSKGNTQDALKKATDEITQAAHKANTRIIHGEDTHAMQNRMKHPGSEPTPQKELDLSETKVAPQPPMEVEQSNLAND